MNSQPVAVPAPAAGELIDPHELMTPAVFARTFPNIVPSETALRYYLTYRRQNGLLEAGAVLEIRPRPEARRVRMLIAPSRFIAWAQGKFGRGR